MRGAGGLGRRVGFRAKTPGTRAGRADDAGLCSRWAMRCGEQRTRGHVLGAGVGTGGEMRRV